MFSFARLLLLSGPLPLPIFVSHLPPTLALWQCLLAERFNSPKPGEKWPRSCCLSCQPGMLSCLSQNAAELKQWCQNEVVGECGIEEARKETCEREAGPSPLVVLRNVVPNSTCFRSVTIRSSSEAGIMSPLDFTHLLLQFFNHNKVSVSTRSC